MKKSVLKRAMEIYSEIKSGQNSDFYKKTMKLNEKFSKRLAETDETQCGERMDAFRELKRSLKKLKAGCI